MARTGFVGRKQGRTQFDVLEFGDPAQGVAQLFTNAGAPTNGASGTGAGKAPKGSLLSDVTNAKLYINTGTLASPTWTVVGSQS